MVVCVEEERSHINALAVTKAVKAVVNETRHDSLLSRVKQCLGQCGRWPCKVAEKFPVVAEVKGLDRVEAVMRQVLVQELKEALALDKAQAAKVVSDDC